ncbi:alpha-1-acid glycoprotein isoform X1 [Manis pentadactyla]|uniref:alpha-1-acid glycoprotein isoform X1 n=1 Tax=Manis pentadactyla TaxID=143292 RepID=UPI00255C7926|nr:alpha-1-acid glycoprotein isoform X1 [Manis pentadactyla]
MALAWALAVLSLLPLLDAQSPECTKFTTVPITNATLDQLAGKWFYIASAFRFVEFRESAKEIQATFFHLLPNHTEDVVLVREYMTIGGKCVYNSSYLEVQRENGTLSKHESGKVYTGYLQLTKDPGTFMLAFFPEDEPNMGLSFYSRQPSSSPPHPGLIPGPTSATADKPEATPEQLRAFQEAIVCMGMSKSEIMYTDEKKDVCGPLEKQHEEERKKEDVGS